jgi:hypothetical protein
MEEIKSFLAIEVLANGKQPLIFASQARLKSNRILVTLLAENGI